MLLDHIREKLNKSYSISEVLCEYLKLNHDINLNEGEVGFIALHIDRLMTNSNR